MLSIYFWVFVFGIVLTAFGRETGFTDLSVFLTIAVFSIVYMFDITHNQKYKLYTIPLMAGYILRLFLLFYDVYATNNILNIPLLGGELSSDSAGFYRSAITYSLGHSISYGGSFSKLFGVIFGITFPSRLLGEFIVLLFSVMTIHVLTKILDEIEISNIARKWSIWLICLMPNYLILSVVFRRETIITFLLAVSFYFFIKWFKGKSGEKSFILSVLFALFSSLFHGATGLVAFSYLMVHLIYSPKSGDFKLTLNNLILGSLLLTSFLAVFNMYGDVFFDKVERVESIEDISSGKGRGGSNYAQYVGNSSSLSQMAIYTIPRYFYFMFSPFPWQWRGISDVVSFLMSSLIYFFVLYKSVKYLRKYKTNDIKNRNLLLSLLIVSFFIAFIFSWGVTNTGTAIRHRDKFIVLYAVMFGLSYSRNKHINN